MVSRPIFTVVRNDEPEEHPEDAGSNGTTELQRFTRQLNQRRIVEAVGSGTLTQEEAEAALFPDGTTEGLQRLLDARRKQLGIVLPEVPLVQQRLFTDDEATLSLRKQKPR